MRGRLPLIVLQSLLREIELIRRIKRTSVAVVVE